MRPDADQHLSELLEYNEAEGPIFKMRDDPRRTRVGTFIRRWSIDELPQFWNVLKGEMSVVGPRPATPREVAQYEDWQLHRLETLPGITGLWQVSGRSELGFSEQVPSLITGARPGELFELRTAGNIVPAYSSDHPSAETATIEFAVRVLGVSDIVVCGHSHCGAVTALVSGADLSGIPAVQGWLAGRWSLVVGRFLVLGSRFFAHS